MIFHPLSGCLDICKKLIVAKYVDYTLITQKNPTNVNIPSGIVVAHMCCCEHRSILLTVVQSNYHTNMCTTLAHGLVGAFIGVLTLIITPKAHDVELYTSLGEG